MSLVSKLLILIIIISIIYIIKFSLKSEDTEEDYDDYDIEDGIHTGKEKTPSPKRDFGGYSSRRRKIFHRSKTKIEEDEEKIINDMDNLELQVDISGNSSSMLALVPPKIRKRSSSTHTDYESDQEY